MLVLDTVIGGGMMVFMLPFFVCCGAFGLLFIAIETISRQTGDYFTADDTRKSVHIIAGLMAAGLPFVLSFAQIVALGMFFIGFMAISKLTHLFPSIHGVERMTLGEIYYPLAIAIVAWLFPVPVIYTYAILVLALGDGFAAVIGIRLGRHPYRWLGAHKSFQGSAVCWTVCLVLTFATLATLDTSLPLNLASSIGMASILTLTEASLSRGLDNLALPLLAAILLSAVV
jgi:phytol kinase